MPDKKSDRLDLNKTEAWIEEIMAGSAFPDSAVQEALESGNFYPTNRDENGDVIPCPLDEWNARGGREARRECAEKFWEGCLRKVTKDGEA